MGLRKHPDLVSKWARLYITVMAIQECRERERERERNRQTDR